MTTPNVRVEPSRVQERRLTVATGASWLPLTEGGLVLLLLGEILCLTFTFDTQSLDGLPSVWAQVVGWAPQYLRLGITASLVTLVLAVTERPIPLGDLRVSRALSSRLRYIAVHAVALFAFVLVTRSVMGNVRAFLEHPAAWAFTWFFTGAATLWAWALALAPSDEWVRTASARRVSVASGIAVGTVVWACGFLTEEFWKPLARYTFALVRWTLGLLYTKTVSDPEHFLIGTSTFKVIITPQCSGYEGVGLIVAFLSAYLWFSRRDLRFPAALLLLPLGAVTIWLVNVLRIVALIAIGTAGWQAVASGGFHSQAGWIAFNAIALGFVTLTIRFRYFASTSRSESGVMHAPDATAAYLGPLVAILATAMLTGAFSAGFDWLYPVRVVTAVAVLWMFRKSYARLTWSWSWWPVALGVATFALWVVLLPRTTHEHDAWPAALTSVSTVWASAWLLFRVVGYVVTVPIAEELAFRGFLIRRLVSADFDSLPIGVFSWASFVISSVLFGAFHGGFWVGGTVAGMAFALALYRRRTFGDAVQAHAITNALLAVYAVTTGRWSAWS